MDAARYRRVRDLFHAAGARTGDARAAYLDEACAGDAELRAEVERLLGDATVGTGDLLPLPSGPPPGTRVGAYELVREIGRGGMGTVYAARAADGATVALKLIHPHLLPTPRLLERFRREARAGRRLDHENVVRTLGVESADDRHYLVLEYVEGRTLRQLADDLGTVPEALLREIARQIAEGLAAIHAAGLVHRDLKPENVLLTADERVRIMDLGVAKFQDASVDLTDEGVFLGSLPYAAPEQCAMDAVGPPADLYSLGVVLYELATGANPFRFDRPVASLDAHKSHVPPPPQHANPDVSAFFGEVVATLLAKRPADRLPDAAALAAVLVDGEAGAWWTARRSARAADRPLVSVRRDTPLHGRAAERSELEAAWRAACGGAGGALLLTGEAGIGKTRLADALVARCAGGDAHVLYGSFPPAGGLQGLTDALVGLFGARDLEAALTPLLPHAPRLVPLLAQTLRRDAPPSGSDTLTADAFRAACAHVLRALADRKPTLWILDDLHFAPRIGRGTAMALARAAAGRRALVVATTRPGGADAARLRAGFSCLDLARLDDAGIAAILEDTFGGRSLAPRARTRLVKKADGVPLFAVEMARALRAVGGAGAEDAEVPSAVHDLLAARLAGLDAAQRALLDVGAVQGFVFDAELVAGALERPLVRTLQDLAAIERRDGLVRADGRRFRFDHHLVQEIVYDGTPPRLREEYHARLADAHAARAAEPTDEDAWLLAHHYFRGRRPEAAVPHVSRALRHLDRRYRRTAAAELVAEAVAATELLPPRRRFDLLVPQAKRLRLLGRLDDQAEAVAELLRIADELDDDLLRAHAWRARGSQRFDEADVKGSLAAFQEAQAWARRAGDAAAEAAALCGHGCVLVRMARYEEARAALSDAAATAREHGDRTIESVAVAHLGLVAAERGDYATAALRHEEYTELTRAAPDRVPLALAHGNLSHALWKLGRRAEAWRHNDKCRALAREMDDPMLEHVAFSNEGVMRFEEGRAAEARDILARTRESALELRDTRAAAVVTALLGTVRSRLGDRAAAERAFDEALALAEGHAPRIAEHARIYRAAHFARADDLAAARTDAEQALPALRKLSDREGEAFVLNVLGRIDHADGDLAAARRRFKAAEVLGKALGIPPQGEIARAHLARLGDRDPAAVAAEVARSRDAIPAHDLAEIEDVLASCKPPPGRV